MTIARISLERENHGWIELEISDTVRNWMDGTSSNLGLVIKLINDRGKDNTFEMSQITSFYPHNTFITPKINIIIKLINNLIILNLLTKIQIGDKEIWVHFGSKLGEAFP